MYALITSSHTARAVALFVLYHRIANNVVFVGSTVEPELVIVQVAISQVFNLVT